ncbi:MAG: tRNA 2-thiouridine(34) synthase MnmA [Deltaproteobacteria bacterium]|nr:tRNA 2-thiouridine(34) synthase MnmA [Deltaproteobacteria bacterium]
MPPDDQDAVAVALSGGVDSAVAASLLMEQGYAVFGVHLLLAENSLPGEHLQALSDALGIRLTILDLREEFAAGVVQYFLQTYARGQTPNPCVKCNAVIKFGVLWDIVQKMGAGHLATGHYVQLRRGPEGEPALYRGRDRSKDQSYFLCQLPRRILPHVLFPLGEFTKDEVRRRARRIGLPLLESCPESQEICFIKDERYLDFIKRRRGCLGPPGDVVDRQGHVVGRHRGLACHTVGQRRGLGIPGPEPYYVLEIQPETNRLVVGPRQELFSHGLKACEVNWLIPPPTSELEGTAVIRYRHPGVAARIIPGKAGEVEVIFAAPQSAVAPGQAVAFYKNDRLLGGGWIVERINEGAKG